MTPGSCGLIAESARLLDSKGIYRLAPGGGGEGGGGKRRKVL